MADTAPPAPKMDLKMLIVPAVLFFGKKIDFKVILRCTAINGANNTVYSALLLVVNECII